MDMQSEHLILVHGMCHGAWCWYKLKPLLESLGHRVTALDMGASGINTKPIEELRTFDDYNEPLISFMASLPADEKVVLVGHSLGGLNLAFSMEKFPEKISAAVFLSSFVPDTVNKPFYFPEKFFSNFNQWMDTQLTTYGSPEVPVLVASFGHKFMLSLLYNLSPTEDYELAKMLVRPLPIFNSEVLMKDDKLSNARYGSVRRVYVVCKEDKGIPEGFVREMIEGSGVKEVKEIEGADHMGMLSKPQQLCDCLVQILAVSGVNPYP